MDDFIRRLCVRLAAPTPEKSLALLTSGAGEEAPAQASRRGFLGTIGKVAVGAATVVAGTAFFTRPAEAASALHCCEGTACPFHGCYAGMALGYTWSCAGYFCHDCFTDDGQGSYFCTYTVPRGHTSSHHTSHTSSHHTSSSHQAAPSAPPSYGGDSGYGGDGGYGPPPGYFGWG